MFYIKKIIKFVRDFLIDNILAKVFFLLPITDTIFIESVPNLSDSPKEIFDELLRRNFNEKYKFVWWLYDDSGMCPQIKNVIYLNSSNRLIFKYYEYTSRCLISCNRFLESHRKKQKSFYIIHGSPIKKTEGYYILPKGVDYFFCASEKFKKDVAKQLGVVPTKGIGLGLPRNDVLGTDACDLSVFFHRTFNKVIVWYPTFRQHKAGMKTGSLYAFPIIHDLHDMKRLNTYAREKNILIVIKPHFAQDLSAVNVTELSNIQFINDNFFKEHGISSYEFVNSCDALISDYSSIYYDYLLCDKPIALAWEDYEEYKKNPGFSVNIEYYCKGGEKIFNLKESRSVQNMNSDLPKLC